MTLRIACIGRHGQTARALRLAAGDASLDIIAAGRESLDLRHPRTLAAFLDAARPEAVINAAAYNLVDRAEAEPGEAFAVNAEGPAALARLCAQRGLPLIHMSTDCVFDGTKPLPYDEEDKPNPLSAYGRSKLAGETAVLVEFPGALVVRVCWVYSGLAGDFVTKMLELAAKQPALRVVSDQIGPPTHALDVAAGLLAATRARAHGEALTGLLHLAAPESCSRAEMAEAIITASRALGGPTAAIEPVTTAVLAAPARRPLNARLDGSRAARRLGLGFRPWRTGVSDAVAAALARSSHV